MRIRSGLVLLALMGLLVSGGGDARADSWNPVPLWNSSVQSSLRDYRDWWPAADCQVVYRVPRGTRANVEFTRKGARNTFDRSSMRVWNDGDWTMIELTVGLRARIAGGYLWPSPGRWAKEMRVRVLAEPGVST